MKIIIKNEGDEKEEEVIFSNDMLNNYNFVEVYIGDKEYTFSIDDLEAVIKAFKVCQKNQRETY